MSRTQAISLFGFVFAFIAFTGAFAEESADPFAAYAKCAAIGPDADRLACFDGLAPAMKAAAAGDGMLAETQGQFATQRAEAFGAENFADKNTINELERLSQISAAVAEIEMMGDRRLKITLENGQIWRQKPDDRIIPAPEKGVARTATIRRAMFGRYMMTIEPEGRTIRVMRQE